MKLSGSQRSRFESCGSQGLEPSSERGEELEGYSVDVFSYHCGSLES